jgi:PhnB protein
MSTAETVAANPTVLSGIAPYLMVSDSAAAAKFYERAFGAKEVNRAYDKDGMAIIHLHLHLNGASLFLMDPMPDHGYPLEKMQGFNLHLQVDDIDRWFEQAEKAGATATMRPQDMFWGDRYGQVKDPYGVTWGLASPIRK